MSQVGSKANIAGWNGWTRIESMYFSYWTWGYSIAAQNLFGCDAPPSGWPAAREKLPWEKVCKPQHVQPRGNGRFCLVGESFITGWWFQTGKNWVKIPILTNIFQRGWFNHQLDKDFLGKKHTQTFKTPGRFPFHVHLMTFPKKNTSDSLGFLADLFDGFSEAHISHLRS